MPRGSSKKLKVELPPPEDLEEDWESSQAEEEEMEDWDSTQAEEDSLQDSLEDEVEEEAEEEAAAARPSSSAEKASSTDTISAPGRGRGDRAHSRWDETGRFPNPTTQTAPTTVSKKRQKPSSSRKPAAAAARKSTAAAGGLRIAANEPAQTRELRNRIFPTLYAIFQQSRGQEQELKVKNRSLRSLTRSCLYHKSEDQLQRTLEDAEALFNKYCALTLKE
ncbi:33 kDa [simian adenovirus 22]|uniref:33 kDa n=1 Tax=simian adenovirus 22 TaxID=175569 RepID=Q6QPH2_9ADEN|nr:33 kDa [Simian adenovirus E22]